MSDYIKLPRDIADCMRRAGVPLSDDQKMVLTGYLIPIQEQLRANRAEKARPVSEGQFCNHFFSTHSHCKGLVCTNCGLEIPDWTYTLSGRYSTDVRNLIRTIEMLKASQPDSEQGGEWVKVGYEYQHEDTGQIGYIDEQQVEWGFFENNPRLQLIGPIYRPQPPKSKEGE